MTNVTLRVDKQEVFEEVRLTTNYTGVKLMDKDAGAYERIRTITADDGQLNRFWNESTVAVCAALKRFITTPPQESDVSVSYDLELSSAFDTALTMSMQKELFSFYVMSITAKWFVLSNKEEADKYAAEAAVSLEGLKRKAYFKKKPVRPTY